ncbi:MAG: NAD-dependent epimerase/dehydratase family protein [Ginsengibacter sp.]|jgi:nucleoside-diphosphate-sugar epimerase
MQEILHPNKKNQEQKILVTGAAGLVGNELVKQLLQDGYKVIAIYHSTPLSVSHPNLKIVSCDILDVIALEEVMQGISHVYHCAAIVSFDHKERYHLLKINVEGTANVVNACIDARVQKLVHVSSVAALGRIRKGETVTEKMNWTQETSNSIYGKSKYLGELEVWRGIGEGLNAVIVNPTIILGGDNWETGSSAIFKTAYNEFKWFTEGISGFVDVRDVVRAMILLMNSEITAQRFILNGENLSYREIFSEIADCFGKRKPYKKVTPFLAGIVWRMELIKTMMTGKKHLLTKETARTSQAKVFFDNSKILKALPQFQFNKIKDTIIDTCAILKEKYHL